MGLTVVGFVPGLGEIADFTSGVISLARGDKMGAYLSFGSMIPFAGIAGGVTKIGRQVLKHGDEAVKIAGKAVGKIDDFGRAVSKIGSKASDSSFFAKNQLKVIQDGCFAAGTPVLTPTGAKPIESLLPGDLVLARADNDPSASVRPHTGGALFELSGEIWEIHVGGKRIETTAEHPLYVVDRGWTPVALIRPGDRLAGHNDAHGPIERVVRTDRTSKVYCLRVEEDHTFFIGEQWWGFSVWVHNAKCGPAVGSSKGGVYVLKEGDT
ncbi:MAG: polymorphic toxin-type HINT domain-containing protein, partial [Mycobacterium sp.]